ncbi:MAG: tetratricopeptide repeat protein [Anaerolineae bacterium]|nr:tetratricopeptide repeat protein [Anaerolineae bacterium]
MKKTLRILAFGFIFALTLWVGMGCSSSTTPLPSSDSQVLLEEAQKAIDAQDWETAISKLEEVLRSTPNSAKAHFLLGNVYAQQDQFTKAEEHFNKALELDPKYVDARSNLGVVYYRQGKLQEAEKAFRTALTQSPNDAEIHYNLGGVLVALNKLDEAISEFRRAQEINPSLAEPYLGLGSVYKMQNKREEALAAFKRYLELSQDPVWKEKVKQMIQEMGGQP